MKKKGLIFLVLILVVSCFLMSSCLTIALVNETVLDKLETESESTNTSKRLTSKQKKINASNIERILADSELTREESFEVFEDFYSITSNSNFLTGTNFDSLGYDISVEDARLYALASGLSCDPTNEYRMLSKLGYSLGNEQMKNVENYNRAKELLRDGNCRSAYGYFSKNIDFLDSEDICNELIAKELVSFKVGGEGPSGGLIFYDKGYYSDGWRYLEAATEDLYGYYEFGKYGEVYNKWGDYKYYMIGTESAVGTGKTNTEVIIDKTNRFCGESYCSKISAAKACSDYSVTKDGVLYDDWFLPSKDELNLMYLNLHKNMLGSFSNTSKYHNYYWSSTEYSASISWWQDFDDGYQWNDSLNGNGGYRNQHLYVRPARAF